MMLLDVIPISIWNDIDTLNSLLSGSEYRWQSEKGVESRCDQYKINTIFKSPNDSIKYFGSSFR